MIICIDVSQRTKDQLETLLGTGGYRDYSEAVEVAIANQLLFHERGTGIHAPESRSGATSGVRSLKQMVTGGLTIHASDAVVPPLFSMVASAEGPPNLAPYPNDSFAVDQPITVDQWIFGQHNKLLPLKATCRALARLMCSERPGNLDVSRIASEVASQAVKLGDYLKRLDESSAVHRDDAFSFAFPYSKVANGDKSRLRYANQFVASLTAQGTVTGLPVELKLANRDQSRTPQILLTAAGWQFAQLGNPVLDGANGASGAKLSDEEKEFLLEHIQSRVPAEAFAYKAVLGAIADGATTPDRLDDALEKYLPKRDTKPFTRAFLTTQRAGVVSRMIDLGLLRRIRDGINVSYELTMADHGWFTSPMEAAQNT